MSLTPTSEVDEHLAFMAIDAQTSLRLRDLREDIMSALPAAMEIFYAQVEQFPATRRFFADAARQNAAKALQIAHWDRISTGRFDEDYVAAVTAVGEVHARIGLEPRWYIGGYALVVEALIKRVVETLKDEFPRLKIFATLSPVPGFRPWLQKHAAAMFDQLGVKAQADLGRAAGHAKLTADALLAALEKPLALGTKSPLRQFLISGAAHYLGRAMVDGKPVDPVARFHLGNGARVERVNWAGDPSAKGLRQSYGLMVNYLYDINRLDRHRALLASAKIPVSGAVKDLFPDAF